VRRKACAMSGEADLFAGWVSVMSVLGGQSMHSGLYPAPSGILVVDAKYTPPTPVSKGRCRRCETYGIQEV
jgi:hypothetical protein